MIGSVDLRVRYAETDQMGVVYHAEYLVWCEIGRTELIREIGLPYAELERQGVKLVVTDAQLRYHAGARYDDPIRVTTRVTQVRSRAVTFAYVITHASTGVRFVSATTTLIAIDDGARPVPLPAHLRQRLESATTVSP
jgi:acyl-CoA thioester hydrolase